MNYTLAIVCYDFTGFLHEIETHLELIVVQVLTTYNIPTAGFAVIPIAKPFKCSISTGYKPILAFLIMKNNYVAKGRQ